MSENGQYVSGSIWFYAPDKVAPIVWTILFFASMLLHIWQTYHYRSWRYTSVLPWAALVYSAGFVMREVSAFDFSNKDKYIAAICLLYGAPVIYEFSNYVVLGRILYYIPQCSPIHPGRVVSTFGFLNAAIEAITCNGASRAANGALTASQQNVGKSLIKASLILQLAEMTCLLCLAGTFHRRCYKKNLLQHNTSTLLHTLYLSSVLISVRTIYRTVEYWTVAQLQPDGSTKPEDLSPIIRYEWFYWVFEGIVMLLNAALQNWQHPGRYLPHSTKVFLTESGERETTGPGYGTDRHFLATLVDPFDLVGLFKGKSSNDRYWETTADARNVGNSVEIDKA